MKTPQEIKQLAIECGAAPCSKTQEQREYWFYADEVQEFYKRAYQEGRKIQRESDINICRQHYSIEGMAQNCAIDIADNTGD